MFKLLLGFKVVKCLDFYVSQQGDKYLCWNIDAFRGLNKILGSCQCQTLSYWPNLSGTLDIF